MSIFTKNDQRSLREMDEELLVLVFQVSCRFLIEFVLVLQCTCFLPIAWMVLTAMSFACKKKKKNVH